MSTETSSDQYDMRRMAHEFLDTCPNRCPPFDYREYTQGPLTMRRRLTASHHGTSTTLTVRYFDTIVYQYIDIRAGPGYKETPVYIPGSWQKRIAVLHRQLKEQTG